ncbi:Molybdopterin molybdenumtransferase [hydrothermal vent metagenome]|uniref:Molybdopterin molybdenumtransferase n=1 Tax=hydrothermal vent metagenome TaxID=652676 RepID=A0A3B0V645_9ZZZZ
MITVAEIDKIIANSVKITEVEEVFFEDCLGRVLAEYIMADRDFPPFDRVMMDGIAIRFTDWRAGKRKFKVQELLAAGSPEITLEESGNCIEVMTGAVCPSYADTIIKYEEVTIKDGVAIIDNDVEVKANQHVHPQASDRKVKDVLIKKGTPITAAEIGVLATVGKSKVLVQKRLQVAIIATGDELVEIDKTPLPHQIRKSNVYNLQAHLSSKGFPSHIFHIVDDKNKLRKSLEKILKNHEVVVLSGGVSKGKLDFVPEILAELGVEKQFHFVKQRPGKPFWFGTYTNGVVFALPGNPNSTFVGLNRYVLPFLQRSEGVEPIRIKARLAKDFSFKPDLTYFLQVQLNYDNKGHLMATPLPGHGSGDLANLVDADGFLELPTSTTDFKAGEVFDCYPYRF